MAAVSLGIAPDGARTPLHRFPEQGIDCHKAALAGRDLAFASNIGPKLTLVQAIIRCAAALRSEHTMQILGLVVKKVGSVRQN